MANKKNTVYAGVKLFIDGKEVEGSVAEIRAEMKKVRKSIDEATIGSEEYIASVKKYKELDKHLQEHRKNLQKLDNGFSFKRIIGGFNNYVMTIQTAINAVSQLVGKLGDFRKLNREQEESKANVKALTGLDNDSIDWLEAQAEELSTTMDDAGLRIRQSAAEIMQAYMLVGSNKPELLKDKKALNDVTVEVMRLAAAADMDLKEAVNAVTTAMNQFGAGADEASRYVNVLAAGSQKGSANVQEQAEAILKTGVAAKTAGLSFEELDGAIEMLGEMGIKGQNAGTYLNAFLMKLSTGARAGKLQTEGLAAVLKDLNDEFQRNEAEEAGKGMALFSQEFSDRGTRAALVLSQNIEKMKEYTAAVTGTGTAYEQAAINSDTAAARMAQLRNELNLQGQELMKELNPAITHLLNGIAHSSRLIVPLVKWIKNHAVALSAVTTAYVAYVAWVNRAVIADKMKELWTGKVTKALKAQWAVLAKNPYAAAAAAVIALTGVIINHVRNVNKQTEAMKAMKEVADQVDEKYGAEKSHIETLNAIVHNNKIAIDKRREALAELLQLVPGYHAKLTEEGTLIDDNTEAIYRYLKAQKNAEEYLATEEKLEQLRKDRDAAAETVSKRQRALDSASARAQMARSMPMSTQNMAVTAGREERLLAKAQKKYDKLNEAAKVLEDRLAELSWNNAEGAAGNGGGASTNGNPNGGDDKDKCPVCGNNPCTCQKKTDVAEKKIKAVEERYAAERLQLKKEYLDSDEMTQKQYNGRVLELELQELEAKLAIAGLEPEKRLALEEKILDMRLKMQQTAGETASKEAKTAAEKQYEEEVRQLTEQHYKEYTSEEEYQAALRDLALQYYEKMLADESISEEDKLDIREKMQDAQLNALKEGYDKEMQARDEAQQEREERDEKELEAFRNKGEAMKDMASDIGQQVGDLFVDLFEGEEEAFGKFFRNVLVILLDSIEKQLVAIQAAAIAEVTIKDITSKGLAGLATAAGKIALITSAFEAGKAALKADWGSAQTEPYWSGGYTGAGAWNEPAGIVHAGEFVANRYAVANPAVRSVLDLIDRAQKTNTIGNLTNADIQSVASQGTVREPAQRYGTVENTADASLQAQLMAAILRLEKTTGKAMKAYEKPSPAYCFVDGEGGIKKAEELADQMKRNAKRQS